MSSPDLKLCPEIAGGGASGPQDQLRLVLIASLLGAMLSAVLIAQFLLPDSDFLVRRNGVVQVYAGADFANWWTSARLALSGEAIKLYDPPAYIEAMHRMLSPALDNHIWSYPPHALLLALPFGLAPYFWALALWTMSTFTAFLFAVRPARGAADRAWLALAVVLMPATLINLFAGQTGLLVGALLIGALRVVETRPALAGVLLGLATIKPQLGAVMPLAFICIGAWRAIAVAIATTFMLVAASILIFGAQAWAGYFSVTIPLQSDMLEQSKGFFAYMMPSSFVAARLVGLSVGFATATQGAVSVAAALLCIGALRQTPAVALRNAIAMVTALCLSPYVFNYDMTAASAALLVLARSRPNLPRTTSYLIALALLAPALVMIVNPLGFPIIPITNLALLAMLAREAYLTSVDSRFSASGGRRSNLPNHAWRRAGGA
jgi:Glycosyltransferase family 87